MIRLGIIDDQPMVLWGIGSALQDSTGIVVMATATRSDGLDIRQLDVLMLDIYLGGNPPCTGLVAKFSLCTKILLMSAARNYEDINACLGAGARGFLHKSAQREEIASAVRAVAAGHTMTPLPRPVSTPSHEQGLSPREREVITMIGNGLTHEQVARRMGVSKHTVDSYIKRVRAKLNLGNKAELALLASRLNA